MRYWMRNRGQIALRNAGAPRVVNVRLMAESFRIVRRLEVWADEDRVLETLIYPEPLYVVVKGVRAPAGRSTLVLVVPEGADRVDRYLRSHDRREVSIAVSPPLVVDAGDPEAAREVTAAFPRVERTVPVLSPVENRAANLRREGRLTEAWEAYRTALEARPHPSTYVWAALTLTALDQLSAGTVTLPAALLAAYVTIWRRALPLSTAAALVLIAFLLGSKTVNEPYVYLLLPILLWEAAERPAPAKTVLFRAVYALPLTFAIVGVPVLMFALPLYVHFTTLDPVVGYTLSPVLPRQPHAVALAVIALVFVGTLLWGWRTVLKETEHALPAPVPR